MRTATWILWRNKKSANTYVYEKDIPGALHYA